MVTTDGRVMFTTLLPGVMTTLSGSKRNDMTTLQTDYLKTKSNPSHKVRCTCTIYSVMDGSICVKESLNFITKVIVMQ